MKQTVVVQKRCLAAIPRCDCCCLSIARQAGSLGLGTTVVHRSGLLSLRRQLTWPLAIERGCNTL